LGFWKWGAYDSQVLDFDYSPVPEALDVRLRKSASFYFHNHKSCLGLVGLGLGFYFYSCSNSYSVLP